MLSPVYPFDDHNVPKLYQIADFCHDVATWLSRHPENVVAVHCKAGKGRTGLMLACYLLHSGQCSTAEEALELFGRKRTANAQGVTIPSQKRYVGYYEQVLRAGVFPESVQRRITQISVVTVPSFDPKGGCNPYFNIYSGHTLAYTSKVRKEE